METNRVRQFCAVAETLNLRQAAELLNMTHSGLFKSLKVLENELGFSLLRKEGRGIVLTEEGKKFYPRAVKFLSSYEELIEQPTFRLDDIRIGTFEVFSTHFFAHELFDGVSDRQFTLKEMVPVEMEKALLADEIDIGITYEPVPMQGLRNLEIGKIEMGLFGKKGSFKNIPFENIPFAPPAIPLNNMLSGVKGLDGWPEERIPRNSRYKVDMLETALQLCSRGKAIGFFPKFVVKLFNSTRLPDLRLTERPLPKKMKSVHRTVYLVLRQSTEETQDIKKIAKCLRQICK